MDAMRLPLQIGFAAALLIWTTDAQAQTRFEGMDRNNDGIITRAEWRGNFQSFRNQDWNGDGVLSGEEVRPGGRRQVNANRNQDWNRDGRVDNVDTQIAQRYRGYDMDNDNRVARNEWPGAERLFTRLDANRDGYLTMQEYVQGGGFNLDAQGGAPNRFVNVDTNRDGWITRSEWAFGGDDFTRLDVNRDNRISRFEFENDTASYNDHRYAERFNSFDTNRDGWVTRSESRLSVAEFNHVDANGDNRLSRYEFENYAIGGTDNYDRRSGAWRSGYDRGVTEGRTAGREDFVRNQGWDLEGQRELERADAGYNAQVGSLSEYQDGYREGFRRAYREGFEAARDRR